MSVRAVLLSCLVACNGASPAPAASGDSSRTATARVAEPERAGQPRPSGSPQPTLSLATVELEVPPRAPVKLRVEVASTDRERQRGLMFREHLDDDAGMLFVFPTESRNSFWMHNTLIPLDMFFIDASWNVVGVVENAEPLTDDPRAVNGASQYVLEVNGGFAKEHGFGAGTKVRFTPNAEGTK